MHIISGKYKRRRLMFPVDQLFRPTKARVKEAVFSMIGPRIEGARFCDICAGTGAIGLEAESRGAARVVCVDLNVFWCQKNADALGASIEIVKSDMIRYLNKQPLNAFDIIYLDPVWADIEGYNQAIDIIVHRNILAPGGALYIEHEKRLVLSRHVDKVSTYGASYISVIYI
tara:strand:- start:5169 stop:5684 length:516 start_codon:yes stop_codon:yes gene_type:complete